MRIKLTQNWGDYVTGTVLPECEDKLASHLIKCGIAKGLEPVKERAVKKQVKRETRIKK